MPRLLDDAAAPCQSEQLGGAGAQWGTRQRVGGSLNGTEQNRRVGVAVRAEQAVRQVELCPRGLPNATTSLPAADRTLERDARGGQMAERKLDETVGVRDRGVG